MDGFPLGMGGSVLGLTRLPVEIRLKEVGGHSSMVESKLVELVVAGSSPVGHPTFPKGRFPLSPAAHEVSAFLGIRL